MTHVALLLRCVLLLDVIAVEVWRDSASRYRLDQSPGIKGCLSPITPWQGLSILWSPAKEDGSRDSRPTSLLPISFALYFPVKRL